MRLSHQRPFLPRRARRSVAPSLPNIHIQYSDMTEIYLGTQNLLWRSPVVGLKRREWVMLEIRVVEIVIPSQPEVVCICAKMKSYFLFYFGFYV